MIGFNTGKTMLLNKVGSFVSEAKYHDKKITQILADHKDTAFVSVSYDGNLVIHSLCTEFDDLTIRFLFSLFIIL